MSADTWLLFGSSGNNVYQILSGTTTRFSNLVQSDGWISVTEAVTQIKVKAGAIDKARCYMFASTAGMAGLVGTRVNGVNGNVAAAHTTGATGEFEDTTHSDTVVDSDLFCMRGTGSTSFENASLSSVNGFHYADAVNSGTVITGMSGKNGAYTYSGTTNGFAPVFGGGLLGNPTNVGGATEAINQELVRAAGTYSNMRVRVATNTNSSASTIVTLRKSGVDGNTATTITASGTGTFEDTTHSDAIADGDLAAARYSASASNGTTTFSFMDGIFVASGKLWDAWRGVTSGQSTAWFENIVGSTAIVTVEAKAQHRLRFASGAKKGRGYVTTAAPSTSIVQTMGINGAGGNIVATSVSGATGSFEDTTHTDSFASGDLIGWRYAAANATGHYSGVTMGIGTSNLTVSVAGPGTVTMSAPPATISKVVNVAGPGTVVESAPTATVGKVVNVAGPGTVVESAPTATVTVDRTVNVAGPGTVTLHAPGMTISNLTMLGLQALAINDVDARVTNMGVSALAKNDVNARVTQMGLLVLAKGGEAPLVPDPLALQDAGRSPVLTQRLSNMYVEPTTQGPGTSARYGRPGLYEVATRGGGPGRCTFLFQGFRITVTGGSVWRDAINIGTIPEDGPCRYAVSEEECVLVAGGNAYYVTLDDVSRIADPDLPRVRDVCFLSGRFIYIPDDTSGEFMWSEINDAKNIQGLSFASAEGSPDPLLACGVLGENLVLFGTKTIEWWWPSADPTAPFQRAQGRRYDKGLAAIQSFCLADNSLHFVGDDRMVYRTGQVPLKVSNYEVDNALRKVTDADLPDITAFTVTFGGHVFYVLNLPKQGTYALDVGQRLWAEWKSWGRDRFRVSFANDNFMLDAYSGKIMGFDGQVFTDLGEPIERVCSSFAKLDRGSLRNFNLILRCIRGVGNVSGNGTDPVVEMRWSDTNGKRWSNWISQPLGEVGQYGKEALAVWTGLGAIQPPGRLYEFRCSDPVEFSPYQLQFNEARP